MKLILNLKFVVALIAVAVTTIRTDTITPAEQCPGESFENLRDRIQVIPCGKSRCHLPRNANITVVFKFVPKREVKTLLNEVHAQIAGVSLPFIGVTGTNVCGHVRRADSGEPVACPLPPDHEYVYTKIFPVLPGYPTVGMRVHWHLHDGDDKVICFEVPATITQGTKRKFPKL